MERNVQDVGDAMTAEEHLDVIKNSLPILADVCDLEPYSGDYSYKSLKGYFDSAENVLNKRSNEATLFVDRQVTDMMRALGKDEVKNLKRDHYNLQLETLVINSSAEQLCKVVDGHIVPDAGFAYLVPLSHNGRAPFYSSVKVLGNMQIKTLWYNVAVLLFMCLCVTICLLYDFPGQKIRKEKR